MKTRGLSLGTRLFVAIAIALAVVLGGTFYVANAEAVRAADVTVTTAVKAARAQVRTVLAGQDRAMRERANLAVGNPALRTAFGSKKRGDLADQVTVASDVIDAAWVQVVDTAGTRLVKSNDPAADSANLAGDRMISQALAGTTLGAYGVTGDTLIRVIALPVIGANAVVGALMAVRPVDASYADSLKAAAGGAVDVVLFARTADGRAVLTASTIGAGREVHALVGALPTSPDLDPSLPDSLLRETPIRTDATVGGAHFVALSEALRSATGAQVGGFVVLRNRDQELAALGRLRQLLLVAGGAGLVLALLLALVIARPYTRTVRALVDAAERAAEGDVATGVAGSGAGEVHALVTVFRSLLAGLAEQQTLVEFMRGMEEAPVSADGSRGPLETGGVPVGSRIAGRYEVRAWLGAGASGTVVKAVDRERRAVIAVKLLSRAFVSEGPGALENFKREIRLARGIVHRNVVRTDDFGEHEGRYYLTREYVAGTSLAAVLRRGAPLPVPVTVSLGLQLCRALAAAHSQGVLHRDLRPEHLLIAVDGVLKVADFGITRPIPTPSGGTSMRRPVAAIPSAYLAPELLMGDAGDARADLYSVASVMYHCLTGAVPFTADSPIALIARVLEETPVAPADLNPEVPVALSDLILRILSKHPADRPGSASELHDLIAANR